MRSSNDAPMDEEALRLWIRTLDVRTIALIVVGVISFFLPTVREHRVLIAAMLFGGVVPYNAILAARVRRRRRLDVFMPVTDLLGAAVMAAVVPATWPAVVAVSVADIAFSVVMFGRRTALVSTALGAAILAAAATRVPGGGSTGLSGFVTAAAIVIFTVGTVNTREKELRRRYRSVAIELQQYADIVEEIQFSLMVSRLEDPDDDRSVTAVRLNPAACRLFSLSADDALGQRVVDIWPNVEGERFSTIIAATIRSGEKRTIRDVPFHRADGSEGFFTVRIFPLPDNCAGLASDDITDQHLAADALRHQALHDSLTGLPNRALLQDRLATALAGAQRTQQSVALLVMDLNQFKEINDTLGHPMGDRMLEQVGVRLAVLLRDCDTVARLGGDEFAVLLTVDASRRGAEGVAVRIRDALTEPFDLMGVAVQTAASIGIVLSPEDGADVDTLLQRADIAMYNAKRSGLGYAFYVSQDDRSSIRRLSLVGELRRALERDELTLYYQPQIEVASGRVNGVEALVRWQHPEHGLLAPNEFIELAEVSGIIQPLTRWVIRHAMGEAARFAAAGHPLVVAANVSARNLYDPDLVQHLRDDLAHFAVPAELFMLELTESELVDDPSQVMTVLSQLSDMGVRLAIDDFGTGWSSLANLTRLPIDQVKIDRSFVSRMLLGGDDAVVVRSVVDLGHNLGLTVVAEGVEDAETLDALAALGCDEAQGYHFSRPVPPVDLLAWIVHREQSDVAALSGRRS